MISTSLPCKTTSQLRVLRNSDKTVTVDRSDGLGSRIRHPARSAERVYSPAPRDLPQSGLRTLAAQVIRCTRSASTALRAKRSRVAEPLLSLSLRGGSSPGRPGLRDPELATGGVGRQAREMALVELLRAPDPVRPERSDLDWEACLQWCDRNEWERVLSTGGLKRRRSGGRRCREGPSATRRS